jgi:hypothetical protein
MAEPLGSLSPMMTNSLSATGAEPGMTPSAGLPTAPDPYTDIPALLKLFEKLKKESFNERWIWERDWLRDIFYTAGRQWIYYHPTRREWIDKRLAKNVPRPVTNKIAEIVQALRASFGAIDLGIVARPVGHNPEAVATAEITDKLAPLIHEEHQMPMVLREADFWLIVTGSAVLHASWDTDKRFNRVFIKHEQCAACASVFSPKQIVDAGNVCPNCGNPQFLPAKNPDGSPAGAWVAYGKGKTSALSPFEWAAPVNVTRFDELPYLIRLRWRDRSYYEANHPELIGKLVWETSPSDRSLQIYKSLATTNDIGTQSSLSSISAGAGHNVEGITEYELWLKPTPTYPDGLVLRVAGDRSPILIQSKEEAIPGPFPLKSKEGMPIFPFSFSQFEHMGGRLYGRSALAPLIQKQDQLNQIDSLTQMIIQRMANPVWIVPEGAGIDSFTGDPGLVLKWNPLAGGGLGKPERIAGENIPMTLFQLRAQYLKDLEELSGTFDILKGQRPAGVEAFSALQLLVERSQARFASAFASRGEMYRYWFSVALEMERQFGPDHRIKAIVSPNKGFTFMQFENAELQGNVEIHIEDGTNAPKTALGKRAAIEHANQLSILDPADPEQRYSILTYLGLSDLVPSLDMHVQSALQIQDAFERWVENPVGPMPLVVKPWHNPLIHYGERIKWLNTDEMKELLARVPLHLQELQMAAAPPTTVDPTTGEVIPAGPAVGPGGPAPGGAPPPGPNPPKNKGRGGGRAMQNSNTNAGSPTISETPNAPQA